MPSPPTTTVRSARAASSVIATTASGGLRDAPAVSGSMRIERPRFLSTPASWSRTSGRLVASLLPTTATVLNAGGMAAIKS